MKEIVSMRRTHSKMFDLGGRKRRFVTSRAPLHYLRDGRLVDIDTTLRASGRLLEVTDAPYRLKIDPERPSYLYTNENGRVVEVEMVSAGGKPIGVRRAVQEAGTVRWKRIAVATDLAFRPLRKGIEALVVLYGPEAPRSWEWYVRGNKELLSPPSGHDAKGQHLELHHRYQGDVLVIEWTGRATSQSNLRRRQGWTEDIAWPVVIDPTVNESISTNLDDVHSTGAYGSFFRYRPYALVRYTYDAWAGFRFQSIAVPQGAVITSATLTIDVLLASGISAIVYGDDVDDAPAWDYSSRVRNITKTSASTNISPSATGLYPIAITGIVQEIVARPGWSSGNDMRFTFEPVVGRLHIATLEHATRTEAQLEIEYEEAGGAAVAPKMMHYRRLRI